jgi:hypothetical protein
MEARQRAIRIFFGNPIVYQGAPQPAIRLNPLRDLVNRPISRPRRERAGHLAYRQFERSRIRCSRRLGPVRFRRVSSQADDANEDRVASKNADGPSLRQHHPPNPTFHARCPTRNEEVPRSASGMPPAEQRRRAIARLACSQIHEEPNKILRSRANDFVSSGYEWRSLGTTIALDTVTVRRPAAVPRWTSHRPASFPAPGWPARRARAARRRRHQRRSRSAASRTECPAPRRRSGPAE